MRLLLTLLFDIPISGVDWVITKVQSGIGDGNDNGDGLVEVFLCSPTPIPLPINYPLLSRDDLSRNYLEKLSGFLISRNHHWLMESE